MKGGKLKIIGLLVGVFALGGVAGAGVMRAVDEHDRKQLMEGTPAEARRKLRLRAMSRKLGLSRKQRQQIARILKQQRERCRPISQRLRQQRDECRQRANAEISEVLTPEQRRKHQARQGRRKPNRPPKRPNRR